jgi:hypothetical protein
MQIAELGWVSFVPINVAFWSAHHANPRLATGNAQPVTRNLI